MYSNPGELFIRRFGDVQDSDSVLKYAAFLRDEAGVGSDPPIDLEKIYAHFDMPLPKRIPLEDQQGLLINPRKGKILINSNDPLLRQRFTEAHELMEVLFAALTPKFISGVQRFGNFTMEQKENLCDSGGAELLMPQSSFLPRVQSLGPSYGTARILSEEYNVSLTAALINMTLAATGKHAVVLWRWKNKPSELFNQSSDEQLSLFPEAKNTPPKRVRVEWVMANSKDNFIPRDQSAPEGSSICVAATTGIFTDEYEYLTLGKVAGHYRCENWPFRVDNEWQVLSLLHLPGGEAASVTTVLTHTDPSLWQRYERGYDDS